jgi:hypothetical protein
MRSLTPPFATRDRCPKDRPRNVAQVRRQATKRLLSALPHLRITGERPASDLSGKPPPVAAMPQAKWQIPAKIAGFFRFLASERLTETAAEPYIDPLGRAAASARWRVREAPHCLHGDRASGHARGHVRVGVSDAGASGCLTSESEERETWTAESLRAAFRAGASLRGNGQEETSAVDVSGQHLVA